MRFLKIVLVLILVSFSVLAANAQSAKTYEVETYDDMYAVGKRVANEFVTLFVAAMEAEAGGKVKTKTELEEVSFDQDGVTYPVITAQVSFESTQLPFKTITFAFLGDRLLASNNQVHVVWGMMGIQVDDEDNEDLMETFGAIYAETSGGLATIDVQSGKITKVTLIN